MYIHKQQTFCIDMSEFKHSNLLIPLDYGVPEQPK